jgi:long-chain acyl-CoA synthetase
MNIKELLDKQVQNFPQKEAIFFEEKAIIFSQLRENTFKLANFFLKAGIKKEDKIAIYLSNTPYNIFSQLATFSIGAVCVPLDFMLTEEEIIHFVNHSGAKILVIQPKKGIDSENIKKSCPNLKEIISIQEDWKKILEESSNEPKVNIEENKLAAIFYTSGSTGHPKGVMLTYRHFDSPIKCIDFHLKLTSQDILLCGGVPLSHIGGFDYLLLVLHYGQTLVLMERFHPLEFLKNIQRYKVTMFWIVPSMYVAILSLKEYEKFDLSSLKYAVVFGAPSSPVFLKRFHKLCPQAKLLNGWGMTETSAPNCILPPGIEKIESVGKFSPDMQAKIVNEEGNPLEVNQVGELWVKGEGVMLGYYKEEKLTKEVLTQDGWLKTGDLAKFDQDGLFYIVGRKKDAIKVAGEIVFSSEVEEKILLHPKIKEVAVIGVSDKLRGEVPKAFVVLKEDKNLCEEELKEFLKKHLAHFKIPHYIEFVKELPKTRTGKIDKNRLQTTDSRQQTIDEGL